jgi:hypothetical protein
LEKEIPEKNMSPRISIIILNYKGFKDTIECLKSLKKISYSNFDILIVDNASPNESVEKIREFDKNIKLIEVKENNGFAAGCNIGFKKVFQQAADYALLLNPDTFVEKDFLEKLVEKAQNPPQGKKIGSLAPRMFYADKKTIYFNGGIVNKTLTGAMPKDHGKLKTQVKLEKKPFLTDYITGTCILIPKSVYEKV